ncbi:type I-C CRISPR-associated endonuclease Cas1c [Acetatifactor muris]|jgi:CRISPR-associated protein Cas1|uniref:CRISPR-associated endonuclease Cas1 n=1 Tax=Acetatifactor muris TaxID=879566 RepID=A0A2K4ZEE5_9FIRM|nr:type I-C CRISPR-associated endonuclease Cas1c [Acetatifactor muris]MCR2048451.1 type I-C CRISPR-associated endonuclease Cas1c [Acetatifactor muris]SOY28837.1 CRISPR-associated protein Cas4/endonuclease Cas1 fusion [Acetatifactor muris]
MKQLLNTLYILTPDTYLFLENEAIGVKIGGEEKVRVPAHTINSVYCFGNVTVSTPLIGFCGQRGISLVFLSEYGKFYGRIQGPVQGNILLRRRQFAALDDLVFSKRLVRSILLGKLVNSREFLMRVRRERKEKEEVFTNSIQKIARIAEELRESPGIDSMRGLEGAAAAAYYAAFSAMLVSEEMGFEGRNRRPPEDPVNALLSFLYTLLKNDVQSALEGVGLDPAAGFLHTLRPGRPALALDLMEELRSPLCDRLCVALINRGQITRKHFEQLTPPVLLGENGRKIVLKAWQERKKEQIQHPFLQEKIPIGLIPHAQAMLLARVLRDELDEYPPFHWR